LISNGSGPGLIINQITQARSLKSNCSSLGPSSPTS